MVREKNRLSMLQALVTTRHYSAHCTLSDQTRPRCGGMRYIYGPFTKKTARLRLKKKHPRQNSTRRRCTTTRTQNRHKDENMHTRRLTRRQEHEEREQEANRLHRRRRGPRGRQWTGPVADERPREAECHRPYGGQQPEHLQGQCACDAERKTIHDADTIPRNRARNQQFLLATRLVTKGVKEVDCAPVSQNVKETHKLTVEAARCRHNQRQESLVAVMEVI